MMLTNIEITKIERIFSLIQPTTLKSIQSYNPRNEFRQFTIVGVQISKNKLYNVLYINIENITPWQLETFDSKVKKELPGKAFIEQHENITRLGIR
jgi:hypothetical protein